MSISKPRIFNPEATAEPKYFTRLPDDVLEDSRLSPKEAFVFAQLLKGHWTKEQTVKLTYAELMHRCRISAGHLRRYLANLEEYGYILRERDTSKPHAPWQITLCYELRPSLELNGDLPVAKGSGQISPITARYRAQSARWTARKARGKTQSASLFSVIENKYREKNNTPPTPSGGEPDVLLSVKSSPPEEPIPPPAPAPAPAPTPDRVPTEPEYPTPDGMWMIHPGDRGPMSENDARRLWCEIWRQWKHPKLCFGFYQHQNFLSVAAWEWAIKSAIEQQATPGHINFLETIGHTGEAKGFQTAKPVQRGAVGQVPYKSGAKFYGAKSCVELEAARRSRAAASVGGEPLMSLLQRAGDAAGLPPDIPRPPD